MKKGTLLKTGILALVFLMAAGVLGIMGLMSGASSTSAIGPVTVGIDFNTGDNTSTTVGAIQTCLEVPSGGSYTLDVYVQNIAGPPSAGMIGGQYTLNSISGNTGTARSVTGGFIDTNPTLSSLGTATIDSGASTPLGSTGSDTPVSSNDPAIGGTGATGDGFWLRMTYTAPVVGSPTAVPLSLADITLNDPSANEITATVVNSALLVIAPGGATTCANLTQPDVAVTKVAVANPVLEPAAASFTITTETKPPVDATNVVTTDLLPTVDNPAGWSISGANAFCVITGAQPTQTLTCTYPTLGVGASNAVTVTTPTMTSDCAGVLNNTATVTTPGENPSKLANNTSSASITVTCPAPPGCGPGTGGPGMLAEPDGTALNCIYTNTISSTPAAGTNTCETSMPCGGTSITCIVNLGQPCPPTAGNIGGITLNPAVQILTPGSFNLASDAQVADGAVVGSIGVKIRSNAGFLGSCTADLALGPGASLDAHIPDENPATADTMNSFAALYSPYVWPNQLNAERAAVEAAFGGALKLWNRSLTVVFVGSTPVAINVLTWKWVAPGFIPGSPGSLWLTISFTNDSVPGDDAAFTATNPNTSSNVIDFATQPTPDTATDNPAPSAFTYCTPFASTAVVLGTSTPGGPTAPGGSLVRRCEIPDTAWAPPGMVFVAKILPDAIADPSGALLGGTRFDISHCVNTAGNLAPTVSVAKTTTTPTVSAGDAVSYDLVTTAGGTGTSLAVTLTDQLPAGLSWVLGGPDAGSCSISGTQLLTCAFGDMLTGTSKIISVSATSSNANCGAVTNKSMRNYAAYGALVRGTNAFDAFSAVSTITVQCPDVSVSKTTSTPTVTVGGTADFSVTTTNLGPGTATNVTTTDTLPTVDAGGWTIDPSSDALSLVDCTITGGYTLTCTYGTMPAGLSTTVVVTAPILDSDCGATLNNTANVTSSNGDPTTLGNNSSSASISVVCSATFTVHKDFSDLNVSSVTVTPSCSSGNITPPTAPASDNPDSPAVFTVSGYSAGATCTANEAPVSGYTESNGCSAGSALVANGDVSCTITNTLNTATVTVHKAFNDGNIASVTVTLTCTGQGPTFGSASDNPDSPAVFTVNGFNPGDSCTASEGAAPTGYTESDDCTAANLTLTVGGSVSCTITNTANPATVTVNKIFSDGNPASVAVTLVCTGLGNQGGSASGGSPAVFSVSGFPYTGTTCTASENSVPAGYTESDDCSAGMPVTAGGSASCTITNTAQDATVTVHKVFSDGNAASVTVTLTCSSGTSNSPQPASDNPDTPAVFTVSGSSFGASCTASEGAAPTGYSQSGNNCTSGNLALTAGGSVSCQITNTLNSATFTVTKVYVGPNLGPVNVTLACGAGTIQGANPTTTPATFTVTGIPAGGTTCTASETSVPTGYTESDTCNPVGGVPLAANGTASCKITNTQNSATFTVTKAWVGANLGSVNVTLACGAGTIQGANPKPTPAVFTVTGIPSGGTSCTASETSVPTGYTESDNCNPVGGVPLAENGTANCTITNTQQPDVTVSKTTSTPVIAAGATGKFKITTSNLGPSTATNLTTTDTLPAGMTWSIDVANTDATSNADCSITGNVLTCSYGSQPSGFSSFVTVQAVTSTLNCGTVVNNASVGADNERPGATANNTATASFTVTCGTGRHDVAVDTSGDDGLKFPNRVHPGQKFNVQMEVENLGTVTETQIGYKVVASCVGTCTGTITLSAACTGTVGPLKPKHELSIKNCTATPSSTTTIGNVWQLTLIVIHCGADGGFPCTTNDGGVDANNTNNVRSRTFTIVH